MNKLRLLVLWVLSICPVLSWNNELEPAVKTRLTVVLIVDQCAYQFVRKLKPYFTGGLRFLLTNGVVYENAYHPHGLPATGTGFTAFNTGAIANYHGVIGNAWFDANGKEVLCDEDTPEKAAVFAKKGVYPYGKSAHHIMVDGLSDQVMLDAQTAQNYVFAISNKSRAAVCLANKLGKAIWFDAETGQFTSSKAYFNELPAWLVNFNKQHTLEQTITWNTLYPATHPAYHLKDVTNYTHSLYKQGFIGNPIHLGPRYHKKEPYDDWNKTPHANQALLDLATTCIIEHTSDTLGHVVVWLGFSSLDLIGHRQGPYSLETTDLLLRLDQQLQQFFADLEQIVPAEQTLYVFSADHGVDPIPELLAERGIPAGRVDSQTAVHDLNQVINKKYGIAKSVLSLHTPNIFLNDPVLKKLPAEKKDALLQDLVAEVKKLPGVLNVWTYDELMNTYYAPDRFEAWYKNQLFPGRSGAIIFQPLPYYQYTKKNTGTTHETPYEFNTHIPLIFYQKNRFKPHTVFEKVWILQVANTIAQLLGVPKPSASTADLLPGLF